MATTTYSEITDIVEHLKALNRGMSIPISEIDGITCGGCIDVIITPRRPLPDGTPEEPQTKIRININAKYKDQLLFHKCFDRDATHEDIVACLKTLPDLKYCKMISELCIDPTESKIYYERKFMEEIFNSVDEVCNYKTDYGECPVCLDNCYTKLDCDHHLCLQCESKMKKKACPQCRAAYSVFDHDGDY
tara:strand:- start:535 stop:1104 length:570 start_codon:yes stop_codon:yes gene_type:complete